MVGIEPRDCACYTCVLPLTCIPQPWFSFCLYLSQPSGAVIHVCIHFKMLQLAGFYISIDLWNHHQCGICLQNSLILKRSYLAFSHQHQTSSVPTNHWLTLFYKDVLCKPILMVGGKPTRALASIPSFSPHWCALFHTISYLRNHNCLLSLRVSSPSPMLPQSPEGVYKKEPAHPVLQSFLVSCFSILFFLSL